jgi:hypothetical protein
MACHQKGYTFLSGRIAFPVSARSLDARREVNSMETLEQCLCERAGVELAYQPLTIIEQRIAAVALQGADGWLPLD